MNLLITGKRDRKIKYRPTHESNSIPIMRQFSKLMTCIFRGALAFYLFWFGPVQATSDSDLSKLENIKLTQLQYIGSHNSYKKALDDRLMTWLKIFDSAVAESLDYAHSPIETQLDLGLRLFEIDLFYDPEGDRYHTPLGNQWPFAESSRPMHFTDNGHDSAFKVMHVQDIDFQTHCPTLKDCLRIFSTFSEENPDHLPIILTLNLKSDIIDLPGFTEPKPFDGEAFLALATEFVEALGQARIFTPAELQGSLPTLSKAVETHGWPDVNRMRGKYILVFDESEVKLAPYRALKKSAGAPLFFGTPKLGHPEAAFLVLNDPIKQRSKILEAVRRGYLVRTRADADTVEARRNNTARRKAAFNSGAQLISTDYYLADPRFDGDYAVQFANQSFSRRANDQRSD